MSNFWKTQVAQESSAATLEAGSIELPQEAVEAHMEEASEDTAEIELLDRDAAVLEDDTEETEEQLEIVEESDEEMTEEDVEALDVAQESIRRRWGMNRSSVAQESSRSSRSRRMVARESLVDDIKTLIQRFIAWLKEQGRKVKDRWLKFSNAGKSIQARSKKFDGAISKLGSKNKDTISGTFIKQLSVGADFKGADTAGLAGQLVKLLKSTDTAATVYADAVAAINGMLGGKIGQESKGANLKEALAESKKKQAINAKKKVEDIHGPGTQEVIGGKIIKTEETDGELTITFVDSESTVSSEVATPSSSDLNRVNDFYNKFGKALEKQIQDYRKVEKAQTDLEKVMEKVLTSIGKAEDAEGATADVGKASRQAAAKAASIVSSLGRASEHMWKTIPTGVSGYIQAGIGAYKKK